MMMASNVPKKNKAVILGSSIFITLKSDGKLHIIHDCNIIKEEVGTVDQMREIFSLS